MNRLIPLLLTVALLATACGDDSSTDVGGPGGEPATTTTTTPTSTLDVTTPEGALLAARQRWAANGPTSYRLTTQELCFCPETVWVNTVVDGEVIAHEPVGDEAFYDPGARTMEALFDEISDAITNGYETLEVDYHPETGAVARYWVDVEAMMADEEYGVQVTTLTPYDPDAPDIEVDSRALVDDYGCGYGFAKGDAAQNLALVIHWNGGFDPEGPDMTAPVVLPAADWVATISTGVDLFANWCDDVIEPDEPTPITDEVWTLVAGTLTTTSEPGAGSCGGGEVTATLSDATAEAADGTRVDLDDVELRNSGWGCFAG
jgi:hypothetical protein